MFLQKAYPTQEWGIDVRMHTYKALAFECKYSKDFSCQDMQVEMAVQTVYKRGLGMNQQDIT